MAGDRSPDDERDAIDAEAESGSPIDPSDENDGQERETGGDRQVDDDERTGSNQQTNGDESRGRTDGPRREVVVPMEVYKTVTVFSTLFAIALVVGGMIALDAGTDRARAEALAEVDLFLAVAGLAALVLGAAVYAFSTRFRAEGMGNAKERDDEQSGNG